MPLTSMKAIVTNKPALAAKYGAAGAATIDQALQSLIAADAARGLTTVVFDLQDVDQMQAVGAAVVIGPQDERGAKLAVDSIHNAHQPDYIMLLDGPDVVPHVALHRIPGVTDADTTTDSDLPYASSAGWSRQASSYLAVTRVVGRLPAARGETNPAKLVTLIDNSIAHVSQAAAGYKNYFAIAALKWNASTHLSLNSVFGTSAALVTSPNAGHPSIDTSMSQLTHFINCHGSSADWRFYGENLNNFPIAMETTGFVPVNISVGAVVAAECCFGAQLYDYLLSPGAHMPICLTYLQMGACAVMGSTNISYGPASANGQADYMAQYFLEEILKGASTGRAMLQARQTFVQNQTMSGPINLKTLAQFLLLGDPSLHPVVLNKEEAGGVEDTVGLPKTIAAVATDTESERKVRRSVLDAEGKALASSASKPGKEANVDSPAVIRFLETARAKGFQGKAKVFSVTGGANFRETAKAFNRFREVAIVMEAEERHDEIGRKLFTSTKAIVGHILGDGVFMIEECESK